MICGLYRQPDDTQHGNPSTSKEFKEITDLLRNKLDSLLGKTPDIFLAGDFNLPHINWNDESYHKGISKDEKCMANQLFDLMNDYNLLQFIKNPTHKDGNVLDLIFTNNIQLLHSYHITPTSPRISHHSAIDVNVHINIECNKTSKQDFSPRNIFDEYNFHSKKVDWKSIKDELKETNWDDLENHPPEMQIIKLSETIMKIVMDRVPKKTLKNSSHCKRIPRDRRILFRKKRKVLKKFTKNIKKMQKKLLDIEIELKRSYEYEEQENERKAVDAIKNNPKYFYSYTKKHSKTKSKVGPLLNRDKELVYSNETMANMLQDQYKSVFSVPLTDYRNYPKRCEDTLVDIEFDEKDIIEAITTMSQNAAAGPDGFPAILLKKCKEELAKPIKIFWRNCLNQGETIDIHKRNNITPIFKGGDQGCPENYRPVSLTSHLTKIFEKVIRKNIVKHLDKNSLFNASQRRKILLKPAAYPFR